MKATDWKDATMAIDPAELVNTNDAIVTRINAERANLARAVNHAEALFQNTVTTYNAVFIQRITKILQEPDAQLAPLPPVFLGNAESPS